MSAGRKKNDDGLRTHPNVNLFVERRPRLHVEQLGRSVRHRTLLCGDVLDGWRHRACLVNTDTRHPKCRSQDRDKPVV